ncbi:MAG TPA: DUF3261 domain-containing protein [Myxococcota bacterium]|nr:DUF3261 domain-containing protein [Myxococcota bacterium]
MKYAARRAAVTALLFGCAAMPLSRLPRIPDCDGPLLSTADIPGGDFRLRERVRIAGDGVDLGLELLAERRADRLVVVGFNEFGARIFSAVQRGLEVETESKLGRALEVSPENVLRDLHEARFLHPEAGERAVVHRAGCDYTATFVRIERKALR